LSDESYKRKKDKSRERESEISRSGRDIGDIPPVSNPARRERGRTDLEFYLREYMPETFSLPFSRDHKRVIAKASKAESEGGLFAVAMPRGRGKSSISEGTALHSLHYNLRKFIALIGSSAEAAIEMLDSIKTELETNERFLEDFPEVCYPIAMLEGISNRCKGQLCNGVPTSILWTRTKIVLPTVEGYPNSGGIIRVAGIEGRIRGMKHKGRDGATQRPDLVIIDDPQTDESARSHEQCRKRINIVNGAILGLAGPGKKIAGIMPCTVVQPDDMADQVLNSDRFPQWQGERTKMVTSWPSHANADMHWRRYAEERERGLRDGVGLAYATEYYSDNRREMDEGFAIDWPECFNVDELSAQQSAMNLRLQDERAFFAERQNDPIPDNKSDSEISASIIQSKANEIPRGWVPEWAKWVTCFIDVHDKLLYYTIAAWSEDFDGHLIDHNTFPRQSRSHYQMRDAGVIALPKGTIEAKVMRGLVELSKELVIPLPKQGGGHCFIDAVGVDANWGKSKKTVYAFAQACETLKVIPTHGRFVSATGKDVGQWTVNPGDKPGEDWILRKANEKFRYLTFDTNRWKSVFCDRLALEADQPGAISLYGKGSDHVLFAEHLLAEYRVQTVSGSRTVDEWKIRPHKPDNHWLDCGAGCAVMASALGARFLSSNTPTTDCLSSKPRNKIKLSERQAARRNGSR